jgi:hypothetical protein
MADTPMDRSITATNVGSGSRQTPQACRWGASTLNLRFPEWVSAWDSPWTCRHPSHSGPLETVDICATCPDWNSRRLQSPRES